MSLLEVTARGDAQAVQAMIQSGVNPGQRSQDGSTALHISARYGHAQLVQFFLNCRLPVNDQNSLGNTPLHMATAHHHTAIVNLLLQWGALVTIPNQEGKTSRDYAYVPEIRQMVESRPSHTLPHPPTGMAARQMQQQQGGQPQSYGSPAMGGQGGQPRSMSFAQGDPAAMQQQQQALGVGRSPMHSSSPNMGSAASQMSYASSNGPGTPGTPVANQPPAGPPAGQSGQWQSPAAGGGGGGGGGQGVMTAKIRAKFVELVHEKTDLMEKLSILEQRVVQLSQSGGADVNVLRQQLWETQVQLQQSVEARGVLERKVREKIAAILEEKNMAVDKLQQMEQVAGLDPTASANVQDRVAYLMQENEQYMAKVTDLEGKLHNAVNASQQVEQHYTAQLQSAVQEKWQLSQQLQQYQQFAGQAGANKSQLEQQVVSLTDRKDRLEAAVAQLYNRLKGKEVRVAELEAQVAVSGGVSVGDATQDLMRKVADLTGKANTLEIQEQNAKREALEAQAEMERMRNDLTDIRADRDTLKDRCATLDKEVESVKLRVEALQKENLELRKNAGRTMQQAIEAEGAEEEDPDESAGLIVFNKAEGQTPQVKGATVEKLVERLLSTRYVDSEYMPAFLLTYTTFMTTSDLLDNLIKYFNVVIPEGLDVVEKERFYEEKVKPVRLCVYNTLKKWIDKNWHHFVKDEETLKRLEEFIGTDMAKGEGGMAKLATSLARMIERKKAGDDASRKQKTKMQTAPKPLLPKSLQPGKFSVTDIQPLELARQLSIIEHDLFCAIEAKELMGQSWNKKDKATRAPHIVAMIARFNDVGHWVTTEICNAVDNKKLRTQLVETFIKIAVHLRELNNFNGVMEILAGLQNSAVHRLKKTWANVRKASLQKFDELKDLMSNRGSYKKFRDAIHHAEPPCIPYLGVYLTDLTFIEDGNPDMLQGSTNLINFGKRRKVAAVVREIQGYQTTMYSLELVPVLNTWMMVDVMKDLLSDDTAYQMSLTAEPRAQS